MMVTSCESYILINIYNDEKRKVPGCGRYSLHTTLLPAPGQQGGQLLRLPAGKCGSARENKIESVTSNRHQPLEYVSVVYIPICNILLHMKESISADIYLIKNELDVFMI